MRAGGNKPGPPAKEVRKQTRTQHSERTGQVELGKRPSHGLGRRAGQQKGGATERSARGMVDAGTSCVTVTVARADHRSVRPAMRWQRSRCDGPQRQACRRWRHVRAYGRIELHICTLREIGNFRASRTACCDEVADWEDAFERAILSKATTKRLAQGKENVSCRT